MTPEALEAWKLTQQITSKTFEDLLKSKSDKTIKKVTRYLLNEVGETVLEMNRFASRSLIIEVLGVYLDRLNVEEEVEVKHGPPPSQEDMLEELERRLNGNHEKDEPQGSGGGSESRLM